MRQWFRRSGFAHAALLVLCGTSVWAQGDETLEQIEQQYEADLLAERWAEALVHAQRAVARVRARSSLSSSEELVAALCRLGFTHASLNDWPGAERSYAEAVQLAEASFGGLDERLLNPLSGLGKALSAQGKHEQAIPVLNDALQVSVRSDGLFDIAQASLLKLLSGSLTAIGRFEAAELAFKQYVQAHEREYGENNPRVIPVRTELAEWYVYIGELDRARAMLRAEIRRVQARMSLTAPELIGPLRALGRSYLPELMYGPRIHGALDDPNRDEDSTTSAGLDRRDPANVPQQWLQKSRDSLTEGERALRRALSVAEANPRLGRSGDLLLDLGDWFLFKQKQHEAISYYKRAIAYAVGVEAQAAAGQPAMMLLSQPVNIYFPPVMTTAADASRQEGARFVLIEYSVAPDGTTMDAHVLEADANKKEQLSVLRAVRSALYRPRFQDGESVRTDGLRYRHVFQ